MSEANREDTAQKTLNVNTYYCEEAKSEIIQLWEFQNGEKMGREVVMGNVDESNGELLEVDLLPIGEGEEFDRIDGAI